jgi:hypothetical protein
MAFFMDEADSNLSSSASAAHIAMGFTPRQIFARHWRESVRYFGLPRHLWNLAGSAWLALLELLPQRRKARFGDLDYDWEHSMDTTRSNVGVGTQFLTGITARPYFATEPWLFGQIMQALALSIQQSAVSQGEVAQAALQDFTFIDLGSGKGRALLMASDFPLRRIVGVEFMPELCNAAEKNIAGYSSDSQKCRQIESVCMDAQDFQFPLEPLMVYLFNPFSEPTFVMVLENLRRSVEQAPRPLYIAYRFTEFERLLAQAAWLEKVAGAEQWAVYGNLQEIGFSEIPNARVCT